MVLFSAVLYLDLPGFAESERMEIPDPYKTWPELLEETIFSQISGEFYFAGHSLGGGLGSLMSLRPGMKKRLKGSYLTHRLSRWTRESNRSENRFEGGTL